MLKRTLGPGKRYGSGERRIPSDGETSVNGRLAKEVRRRAYRIVDGQDIRQTTSVAG